MTKRESRKLPDFMTAKFDYLVSEARSFPYREIPPSKKYLLISTPRTGSTLVGEMLYETGKAGDPQEYLSPGFIQAWQKKYPQKKQFKLHDYITKLERRKSSPNGVFGINVQFLQFSTFFDKKESLSEFIKTFDCIITLGRKDKVAQAVSWWRAKNTSIWSSMDYEFMPIAERNLPRKVPYSAAGISEKLALILRQEMLCKQLCESRNIPYEAFFYEDIVNNFGSYSQKILHTIGITDASVREKPPVDKQGSDDDPMIIRFCKDIGMRRECD
jgi:trehalose 2-sulfotransferase